MTQANLVRQIGVQETVAPAAAIPLVVDMDGTLLRTDTLAEAFAEELRRRPLAALWRMGQLPFDRAGTKARLQAKARINVATLPVDDEVLAYCLRAKAEGRPVWLVSAADQAIVERVARRFGVFDRAIGSDGTTNNKGAEKARLLEREAPGGFEYVGDSHADLAVWSVASAAAHVGGGEHRRSQIAATGVAVTRSFAGAAGGLAEWRRALRLHQWAKNALIFAPAALAMKLFEPATLLALLIALPLMGAMASGTYILNDLVDLSADRSHPTKKNRPFASGRLKLWSGLLASPLLMVGGLTGGFLLSPGFGVTLTSYLVMTLSYSLMLKRVALADTLALSFLYTLRLIMGAVLANVALSSWLMVFSMFLFVSLSLAKRHTEVLRRVAAGERRVANRGYKAEDAGLTLGLGLATAAMCPLIMVLYLMEAAWPSHAYSTPEALWFAPVLLSLWLMRVWLLANRGELDDDPVVFAVRDPQSLAIGAVLLTCFAAAALLPEGSARLLNVNHLLGLAP